MNKDTGRVDFENVRKLAKEHKPKMIICGGSAYPRFVEFEIFSEIAKEVDAFLMADIAHPSGLIAAGVHPSPVPYCDVITSTTHKTLRGPRGGIIMMGKDKENTLGKIAPKSGRVKLFSELLNTSVMPGMQGGPLMHIISAKAIAFGEAMRDEFKSYASNIVENAKIMAQEFIKMEYDIVSGGTDTHVVLVDLTNKNISGKAAENALEKAGITVNKNMVPFDQRSPFITSGIRIGTPAITTRNMGVSEMKEIAKLIDRVIIDPENDKNILKIKSEVEELCELYPIYKELSN